MSFNYATHVFYLAVSGTGTRIEQYVREATFKIVVMDEKHSDLEPVRIGY